MYSFEPTESTFNHEGIWTLNLLIRSQTPYPLGHVASIRIQDHNVLKEMFAFDSHIK